MKISENDRKSQKEKTFHNVIINCTTYISLRSNSGTSYYNTFELDMKNSSITSTINNLSTWTIRNFCPPIMSTHFVWIDLVIRFCDKSVKDMT